MYHPENRQLSKFWQSLHEKKWNSGNFGTYFVFGVHKIRTYFGPMKINTLTPNFDNFVKIAFLVTEFFMINGFRQNSIFLKRVKNTFFSRKEP